MPTSRVLGLASAAAAVMPLAAAAVTPMPPVISRLFNANERDVDGKLYECFRIPSLKVAKSGRLLAFAEGRGPGCKDHGDVRIVLRRSVTKVQDIAAKVRESWASGKPVQSNDTSVLEWEKDIRTVAHKPLHTVGNPSPVVDVAGSGRIGMHYNLENKESWYVFSDTEGQPLIGEDEGLPDGNGSATTGMPKVPGWSFPLNLTAMILSSPEINVTDPSGNLLPGYGPMGWFASGVGGGTQMRVQQPATAKSVNRLVTQSILRDSKGKASSISLVSDDLHAPPESNGGWRVGGIMPQGGQEAPVTPVPFVTAGWKIAWKLGALSRSGNGNLDLDESVDGKSWSHTAQITTPTDLSGDGRPDCQASLVGVGADAAGSSSSAQTALLMGTPTNPKAGPAGRYGFTIFESKNNGQMWAPLHKLTADNWSAGYSALAHLDTSVAPGQVHPMAVMYESRSWMNPSNATDRGHMAMDIALFGYDFPSDSDASVLETQTGQESVVFV